MSGIAEVLLNLGYRITGSDLHYTEAVKRLERLGGKIFIGHQSSHIGQAQVVVVSSAVSKDNIEVKTALEQRVPVIPRAEMLSELMRMKYSVAIAGSHGKTTTTSLVATVLASGGLDPTAVIGGKFNRFGSHAKLGQGDFLVAEADESDGSFLHLNPTVAVVTNIDREHMDFYHSIEAIREAFLAFMNKVPFYGLTIVCLDQEPIQALLPQLKKRYVTYGMTTQADLVAKNLQFHQWESEFTVWYREKDLGRFRLPLPGLHNVYNALAAITVGLELDVGLEPMRSSLAEFAGVERRFELIGEKQQITIIDDYAHHPTEIKATLNAVRTGWNRRLVVVFQPHRYTRTRDHLREFSTAFYQADSLILTEIYPAGESPIQGVDAQRLYEEIRQHGHRDVRFAPTQEAILDALLSMLRPRDIVVTLGAGDVFKVGKMLLERL